jgi:hypothetical protein
MNTTSIPKILGPSFSLSDPWELKRLTTLVSVDFPSVTRDRVYDAISAAVNSSKASFSRKEMLDAVRTSLKTQVAHDASRAA